jgi:hypothetical protein
VPDYEITMAGRIGPAVASCLPGFRSVVPPATVLRAVASNQGVVLELLGMLADHHLTLIDVRINPAPTCPAAIPAQRPAEPTESTAGVTFSGSRSGDLRQQASSRAFDAITRRINGDVPRSRTPSCSTPTDQACRVALVPDGAEVRVIASRDQ